MNKCIKCKTLPAEKGIKLGKKEFGLCKKCSEKALVAYILQFMSRKNKKHKL